MRNVHLPHFSGVPRQRGRGLGALAGTIARTAFPILKRFVVPAAKKNWKRCYRYSHTAS